MKEPTFVIAGGQRCGTTTLYHLLAAHPDVFMAGPPRPEPKFFLRADPTPEDRREYLRRWFAEATSEAAVGEKSTSYLEIPGTARRIKVLFPQMRVLFVLRHPVDRAISNYRFSREHGLETEPLAAAVRRDEDQLARMAFPGISGHPLAYVRRGRYIEALAEYLREFRRDELLVVLNDDLEAAPRDVCRTLYEFLGVDPDFQPPGLGGRHNAHRPDDLRLDRATLDYLLAAFRESNQRLAEVLGRDLSAWDRPSRESRELLAD